MIDIGYRALGANAVDTHCFKFQIRHRTGSVLRQSLVNTDTDIGALHHFTGDQMILDDFLC